MVSANRSESTYARVLLVSGAGASAWADEVRRTTGAHAVDAATVGSALEDAADTADAAVIDGAIDAPLALARRLCRRRPHLQIVIVVPPDRRERLRRQMLFTPGLGEPWLVVPEEIGEDLVERAARVGERKRTHARRSNRIAEQVARILPAPARRTFLSDRYLATLLELLPEPVLALDEDDRILFTNPVASSLFRLEGGRATRGGREDETPDVRSLLDVDDPAVLDDLLRRGRRSVDRAQVSLRTPAGERATYRAAVAPVGGEQRVRAVLLHDVTEQVEARETLERQADRLAEESAKRQRLLEERDRALADLKDLMQRRSRFYANISHELRTPLNAIVGYVQLLLDELYGGIPEPQREVLDRVRRASEHLMELIEDLLDLSTIEAEKLRLQPREVDVAAFLDDLNVTMEPAARERSVELRTAVDPDVGSFRTDPRRFRQIVMNLVSNAIRFGAGRPVDVRCRRTDDGRALLVEVEDRGPGIPVQRQDEVFEEFVQIETAGEKVGTGLGLSIARSLARSFGGEIEVTSEPGEGSVFAVTLPELWEERR